MDYYTCTGIIWKSDRSSTSINNWCPDSFYQDWRVPHYMVDVLLEAPVRVMFEH